MGQGLSHRHHQSMVPRVLHIPEILSLIFRLSDTATRRNAALVCKAWMEPALDELWRSITPLPLFRLLAPMRLIGDGDSASQKPIWIFSSFISPHAWPRFDFYTNRVRELIITDQQLYTISLTVFTEFSRARPRLVVLPRLQHLTCSTSFLIHTTLFMHPGLRSISVKLDDPFLAGEGFKEAKAYLTEISARLPNLTILDITASFSVVRVESELIQLLRGLRHLKEFILPRYWITNSVLTAVDQLPALKVIQWDYHLNGEGDPQDILKLDYIPSEGSFPSLVDFNIEANIPSVINTLRIPFASRLTIIYIRSHEPVSPPQMHEFLLHCEAQCSSLTQLNLEFIPNVPPLESFPEQVTIETLSPIFSYKYLTHFSFQYFYPLSLTDDDIARLASSCPSLVSLKLGKDPYLSGNPNLTLQSLLPLAEYCPNLEELALYLDANVIPQVSDLALSFKRIQSIDFGNSLISPDKIDRIALFLSHICTRETSDPDRCTVKISSYRHWDLVYLNMLYESEPVQTAIEERVRCWSEVDQRLPVLLALRVEERMRSRHLQVELEKLRSSREQKRWTSWSPFSHRRRRPRSDSL